MDVFAVAQHPPDTRAAASAAAAKAAAEAARAAGGDDDDYDGYAPMAAAAQATAGKRDEGGGGGGEEGEVAELVMSGTGMLLREIKQAVEESAGVLLCVDDDGACLKRTWVLWEMWSAVSRPHGRPHTALVPLMSSHLPSAHRARLYSHVSLQHSKAKFRSERDVLLEDIARTTSLDRCNAALRTHLLLAPVDYEREMAAGAPVSEPRMWDFGPLDAWLALPASDPHYQAAALVGERGSGKSVAAAAVALHWRDAGVPVAVHFVRASDPRSTDALEAIRSFAYQLSRQANMEGRLLHHYANLTPEVRGGAAATELETERRMCIPAWPCLRAALLVPYS